MGLKGKMRRLERAATEKLESLELEDRSRYYYDAMEAGIGVFLHTTERLALTTNPNGPSRRKSSRPSPVPRTARRRLIGFGGGFVLFPYDPEAFVERGELVRHSLVVGYEPGEPIPCLSKDHGT